MYVMYGLALTKRWEARLVVAELKMLQVSARMTRMGTSEGQVSSGCLETSQRGKDKMVWICAQEGQWMLGVEYRAARQKEERKTTQNIHGCHEGGHADGCETVEDAGIG